MVGKLQKRKGTRNWVFRFKDQDGRWTWKSTGTTNRRKAEAMRREFSKDLILEADRAQDQTTYPLESALQQMLADCRRHNLSSGTLDMYDCKARHLTRVLGAESDINSLTLVTVNSYIDIRLGEGASHHTLHKELVTLGKTLRLMKRMGHYQGHPKDILPEKFGQGYVPKKRHLTEEEFVKLVPMLPAHRRTMIETIVALGLRKGEAERMRASDIDFDRKLILIRGTKTKKSMRTIPIGSDQEAVLKRAIEEKPEGRDELFARWGNMHRGLRLASKKAKIEPVSANDLRRTFATWRINRGFTPSVVGALMGHVDGSMVERVYGQRNADTLREAMECSPEGLEKDRRQEEKKLATSHDQGHSQETAGLDRGPRLRQDWYMTETKNAGSRGHMGSRGSEKGKQINEVAVGRARIELATPGLKVRCSAS